MSRRRRKVGGEFGQLLRVMAASCESTQCDAPRAALLYTTHVERGCSDRTQFIASSEALAGVLAVVRGQVSIVSEAAETDIENKNVAFRMRLMVDQMRRTARLLTLGACEFERAAKAIEARPSDID